MADTPQHVLLKDVTLGFSNVFEAKEGMNGGAKKFSATFIWPKTDKATTKQVQAAIVAALASPAGKKVGLSDVPPKDLNSNPLHDGDKEARRLERKGKDYSDDFVGTAFIRSTATEKRPPKVIVRNSDGTYEPVEGLPYLPTGIKVAAKVRFYPFSAEGKDGTELNSGVAVSLEQLLILDRESLASVQGFEDEAPEDAFGDLLTGPAAGVSAASSDDATDDDGFGNEAADEDGDEDEDWGV